MISVSNDETAKEAGAFAKATKATFPVMHDPKGTVFTKFGVDPIPANVVIDRKGQVTATIEGTNIKALETAVNQAMAKK